ncbi:outer membrane beta-barrel protein [Luteibaculum oceani]|uniref:PorT family protein n=1 Tax=Luteibaculum oceani TaxID=1294296 RepID=A0A5C6VAQ9_9FLAO|nr:outer membrane beta-barrel protein [Luteibaculum oceani]TXC81641.1 PorT family protein [Luteibaculum oceani]
MRHLLTLTTFLLITATAQAQMGKKLNYNFSVFTGVTGLENSDVPSEIFSCYQTESKGSIGGQFNVAFPITKNIEIQSGIGYHSFGYKHEYELHPNFIDPRKGFIFPQGEQGEEFYEKRSFHFIQIPLVFNYNFHLKNDNQITTGLGVAANRLLYTYDKGASNNYKWERRKDKERYNSGLGLSVKAHILFTSTIFKTWKVSFGPEFEQFVNQPIRTERDNDDEVLFNRAGLKIVMHL